MSFGHLGISFFGSEKTILKSLPLFIIAFMSLRSSRRESFLVDASLSSDWLQSSVFEFLLESNVDSKIMVKMDIYEYFFETQILNF